MFVVSELMSRYGVKAVFSDRDGGCSEAPFDSLNLGSGLGDPEEHVLCNLNALSEATAIPLPHQAMQVHGTDVLHCSGTGKVHRQQADILIATENNVSLAVRTADCVPILLADVKAKVIAAVHAGWRGTVAKAVAVAVDEMIHNGASVEAMVASIGPSIHSCCFEINDTIREQLKSSCGSDVSLLRKGKLFADLAGANMLQLHALGLRKEKIELSAACTSCHVEPRYFSYRRDHGETGRQLSMIMLP